MTESRTEKPGKYPDLRNILAIATLNGRVLPPSIDIFDLGSFSATATRLAYACYKDIVNADRTKVATITRRDRILIENSIPQAFEKPQTLERPQALEKPQSSEKKPSELITTTLDKSNKRRLAMIIRTCKNTDQFFLPATLYTLLLSDSEIGATTAVLLVGRTQTRLFFRGQSTPKLSDEDAKIHAKFWQWNVQTEIEKSTDPNMGEEELTAINNKAENDQLLTICKKYDLSLFSGARNDNIATKQTLQ